MDTSSFDERITIALVGLGYVGLPLAVELGKTAYAPVIGFDVSEARVKGLSQGFDKNLELTKEEITAAKIDYTADPAAIRKADFIIVAVPTPVDDAKVPDFSLLRSASQIVGENLQKGAIVVFESTVYPGATEEICVPIIEKYSGLRCGPDWKVGYSPERVNPGDKEHTISTITKIVSGMDAESLETISQVYGSVCKAGVFQASSVKVAEAAKVIENIQRDLNIALVNELSLIFRRLDIPTKEILEAAGTKWNFHKYRPGLVGGHCIGVDPYYLTYKAEQVGYHPQVILAGRKVNDSMAAGVARTALTGLFRLRKNLADLKVGILGLTFKENVADTRNSKAQELIQELKYHHLDIYGFDPLVSREAVKKQFGIQSVASLQELPPLDLLFILVPHDSFRSMSIDSLRSLMKKQAVLFDVPAIFYNEFPKDDKNYAYFTL